MPAWQCGQYSLQYQTACGGDRRFYAFWHRFIGHSKLCDWLRSKSAKGSSGESQKPCRAERVSLQDVVWSRVRGMYNTIIDYQAYELTIDSRTRITIITWL
ncbi:hypothetical protein N7G274_001682 [Stereocaulon virgatum]|uniref:Uncharacterized protein n=1 Tax=Stereocaulon virgatum TaxID=373712 RepID=A0ABR4AKE1_9LECA